MTDPRPSDPKAAARAIDAVRRGWPVAVGGLACLAIETADDAGLAAFDPDGRADILIGAGRAATLKLANQIEAADPERPVRVARAKWIDLDVATALADPGRDLATPLKGPFRAAPLGEAEAAAAVLRLARIAGVLPAYFVREGGADTVVTPTDIAAHEDAARLAIATRARLPVSAAEDAEIVAFRSAEGGDVHVALIVGRPDGNPPLVRLHSECLTGDVLGSLKCDCGPQLHAALAEIAGARWGILLYLRQEGRGIGLINKLRAYQLQDQGFDTVDANTRLGFAIDARDFGVAARMLALLGQDKVRLLTNNPAKVAGLEVAGIAVVERVPHALPANPFNQAYLATKRDRTGHQF
ncbi:GTP cyclohydrolase II [Sphingomonas gilva]|uniref:GTP cyclohydrolase-2 n=1 Tax=Sphingomonas gilva TaxID=2305907 RepID=A0A396RML2_9SPHN|nr:GTP cyclohydrolase II [Sphingomonas gilva]RHW17677.1 GTP cyclohydrolase II [Sphingomonas gilva]